MCAAVVSAGCTKRDRVSGPSSTTTTAAPATTTSAVPGDVAVERRVRSGLARGGSIRVAVPYAPDVGAATLGGAAVRSLVLPQLFFARPDGRWAPSLVAPGTDRTEDGSGAATFRLRDGAVWSDGAPITVEDLRRTADARFVASVEGPSAEGVIRVVFTQALPGWRRLWSHTESIAAPRDGVWGGPFVVASSDPGIETVLRRNDRWWGAPAPFIDEVRLVLVPDPVTARNLFAAGQLDVISPPADTVRTAKLRRVAGASVDVSAPGGGGWWVGLVGNPARVDEGRRRAIASLLDRPAFVNTLLRDEATLLQGLAGGEDATWAPVAPGWADMGALSGAVVDFSVFAEEPLAALIQRAMMRRVRDSPGRGGGARLELRVAEADRVEGWIARGEFGMAVVPFADPPGGPCWRCRWESVDGASAARADGGDVGAAVELEARLRDAGLVVPLWRSRVAVASREDAVEGVVANGWALSPAWNAWEWAQL